MAKHALLSPSASHRWLHCTNSIAFVQKKKMDGFISEEDSSSVFAQEGTEAHAVAEDLLLHTLYGDERKVQGDEEMEEHAHTYTDYILSVIGNRKDIRLATEQRVSIRPYEHLLFGTVDCYLYDEEQIDIIDYKYGKGVKVSVEDNPQLLIYALGIAQFHPNRKRINIHIVQPRIGNIVSAEYTPETLAEWFEKIELLKKVKEAITGTGSFSAGEHCKFCPALTMCKVYAEYITESRAYDNTDFNNIEPNSLLGLLERADAIGAYITKLKEYISGQLNAGVHIEGFKLIEGRGRRAISDENKAMAILEANGYTKEQISVMKLKTITALEKLVGKKAFGSLLSNVIEMKAGTPNLVYDTDPRPAISTISNDLNNIPNL